MARTAAAIPPRKLAALGRCLRCVLLAPALVLAASWASAAGPGRGADPGRERAPAQTTRFAGWVVNSGDNRGLPFMIIDKVQARVLLFDASGFLQGASSALLGQARGDDSVPGIGERRLSSILPAERTTPAGRFVASLDRDRHGQELLWIDYDTALALHRVVQGTPSERRAQRLASSTPADNRVSYGCINVPAAFYDRVVSPAFTGAGGVVYILPEIRGIHEVFPSYNVAGRPPQRP